MLKIAVLISGGGSNLESIINNIEAGVLSKVEIVKVISDREALGIEKAKKRGIDTLVLDRKIYKKDLSKEILKVLKDKIDYIVLAGYLSIVDQVLINEFENKIINIHPSLIPSFCGNGMYGLKIHRAAIERGVKYSGCTVHFVNNIVDGGIIIKQEIVKVDNNESAESLQKKVLEKEHLLLPEVIGLISENRIMIKNGQVQVKGEN